ncbi:MAG: Periplasmic aromatic aldehyde oxidoreductase, molybdenum binding subunit YagR, partial [uncultured Thermomicrobiales bacterium]
DDAPDRDPARLRGGQGHRQGRSRGRRGGAPPGVGHRREVRCRRSAAAAPGRRREGDRPGPLRLRCPAAAAVLRPRPPLAPPACPDRPGRHGRGRGAARRRRRPQLGQRAGHRLVPGREALRDDGPLRWRRGGRGRRHERGDRRRRAAADRGRLRAAAVRGHDRRRPAAGRPEDPRGRQRRRRAEELRAGRPRLRVPPGRGRRRGRVRDGVRPPQRARAARLHRVLGGRRADPVGLDPRHLRRPPAGRREAGVAGAPGPGRQAAHGRRLRRQADRLEARRHRRPPLAPGRPPGPAHARPRGGEPGRRQPQPDPAAGPPRRPRRRHADRDRGHHRAGGRGVHDRRRGERCLRHLPDALPLPERADRADRGLYQHRPGRRLPRPRPRRGCLRPGAGDGRAGPAAWAGPGRAPPEELRRGGPEGGEALHLARRSALLHRAGDRGVRLGRGRAADDGRAEAARRRLRRQRLGGRRRRAARLRLGRAQRRRHRRRGDGNPGHRDRDADRPRPGRGRGAGAAAR